jgi:hypothetical protein
MWEQAHMQFAKGINNDELFEVVESKKKMACSINLSQKQLTKT